MFATARRTLAMTALSAGLVVTTMAVPGAIGSAQAAVPGTERQIASASTVQQTGHPLQAARALQAKAGKAKSKKKLKRAQAKAKAKKAMVVAAAQKGDPYRWGAVGPRSFDCSGLTLFSFRKAGKNLPRTAQQQFDATRRIKKKNKRRGDLIFIASGTRNKRAISHVGIYAGRGKMWHAPRTGSHVQKAKIYTKNYWVGRVK